MEPVSVSVAGDRIIVSGGGQATSIILRLAPGRAWNAQLKRWELPVNMTSLRFLEARFPDSRIEPGVCLAIKDAEDRLEAADAARDAKVSGKGSMPVKGDPFDHQRQGYEMALILLGGHAL